MIQQSHFCVYTSKGNEIMILNRLFHDHIHCSVSHNIQDMETSCVSITRLMIIQPQKEGSPAICDNLDALQGIAVCKVNQRERQILYHLTYV